MYHGKTPPVFLKLLVVYFWNKYPLYQKKPKWLLSNDSSGATAFLFSEQIDLTKSWAL